MKSGVVLLKKPAGLTSFQALGALKKALGHGKIGHTGTLDKFATGLLIVMVGKLTRLASRVESQDKSYKALIHNGVETSTLDPEGEVVKQLPPAILSRWILSRQAFLGEIMQAPPLYSAIHVQGKRAYERARDGEEVEMQPRPVTIKTLEITAWGDSPETVISPAEGDTSTSPAYVEVLVRCSKGTYIRSLARDWGHEAGTCGSLVALERLTIGAVGLEEAVDPRTFNPEKHLLDVRPFLPGWGLQEVTLLNFALPAFLQGKNLQDSWFLPHLADLQAQPAVVFSPEGTLCGMIEPSAGGWKYGFVGGE